MLRRIHLIAAFGLSLLVGTCSGCDSTPFVNGNDSSTPEVVWEYDLKNDLLDNTQPLLLDGTAYVVADHYLFAFDAETGEQHWKSKKQISTGGTISGKVVLHDGNRLFLRNGSAIWVFDRSSGVDLWKGFIPDFQSEGGSIMAQTSDHLYIPGEWELVQMDKSDGDIVRRIPFDTSLPDSVNHGVSSPVPGPEGMVYVPTGFYREGYGATEGRMHAMDPATGEIQWAFKPSPRKLPPRPGSQDSVLTDTAIYGADVSGDYVVFPTGQSIFALDRTTGEKRWRQFYSDDGFDYGLTIKNGVVYVGSVGERVYALDLQTGEQLWSTRTRGSITTILTVRDGDVYFCNEAGGELWVLDAETGEVIWHSYPPEFSEDDRFTYLSPLGVGKNYMVNVGSRKIYGLTRP